jgi:hypothetical protein
VRVYLFFMLRDGWSFHLTAEDCRTVLTPWRRIAGDKDALLRMIAKLRGSVEDAEHDIRRCNRGGVWVDLSPAQCRYFGIR